MRSDSIAITRLGRGLILVSILLLVPFLAQSAHAFIWQWPFGTFEVVDADDGSGALAGITTFDLWYANQWPCGDGCTTEIVSPNEARYVFDHAHGIGDFLGDFTAPGEIAARTTGSNLRIVDDGLVDQALIDWAAPLGLALTLGQEIDLLEFNGETAMANPSDTIEWTVRAIYTTTEPHSGIDQYSTDNWNDYPTNPSGPDLLAVEAREGSGSVFSARGDVVGVPEVHLGLGLLGGCAALLLLRKRRASIRTSSQSA